MDNEILNVAREKGLLLEKDVYDLVNGFQNIQLAKSFLEKLESICKEKIITKAVLNKNTSCVESFLGNLDGEEKKSVERIFINLGIQLEFTREKEIFIENKENKKNKDFEAIYAETSPEKKLEVGNFIGNFRARFQQLQRILMSRTELQKNLVSVNKISSDRATLSIIGMVMEKRVTKNKNLIIRFEDLTGEINALVKFDKKDIFVKAEELQLDDVVGVKASGNSDMLFVHDIFFPDALLPEKIKFEDETNIAFLSDLHCGSDRHLKKSFEKFLEWLNNDSFAKKIKYLFFVGDNVDGVGIFPGQEDFLELKSMSKQYDLLANYLKKIPKNITMFLCPGQHDAVRVAEPQPPVGKKYAAALHGIENLFLVSNPALVKLYENSKEFKILMYHGASIHAFINNIKELREMKAHTCPAKAIRHMLKRRHLAPTHSEFVYIPGSGYDPLVISEVPDVLCTGEVHRLDIENYNGILIITGSCWQAQTSFEEKVGNIPDPAKVPVLNLKTREIKIFDFSDEEELAKQF